MKTAQEYFDEYAVSHQNETNQAIHYICVPLIFFSVVGLFMSIPTSFLEKTFGLYNPLLENWAAVVGVIISFCNKVFRLKSAIANIGIRIN